MGHQISWIKWLLSFSGIQALTPLPPLPPSPQKRMGVVTFVFRAKEALWSVHLVELCILFRATPMLWLGTRWMSLGCMGSVRHCKPLGVQVSVKMMLYMFIKLLGRVVQSRVEITRGYCKIWIQIWKLKK